MAMIGRISRRLLMLARRRKLDRDLDDEMRLHAELIEQQLQAAGMSSQKARAIARRRFGDPLRIREQSHDALGWRWLDELAQDVRYGIRSLVTQRAFAITSIATLALGIGATTAIFSVVSGVVLRPLPFAQPDRLVQLYGTPALRGEVVDRLEEIRSQSTAFEALVGYDTSARYLRGPVEAERVMTVRAEHGLFSMLGVPSIAGRTFRPEDPAGVAVLSERFWRQRFAGAPSVVGMSMTLDDEPFTVIGVMPESFQFPYGAGSSLSAVASQARTDMWIPRVPPPLVPGRPSRSQAVGRLKANITVTAAESELAVITARLAAQYPDPYGPRGVRVAPFADAVVAPSVRRPLFMLFGAVGLVLALACANVMNLALVRMSVRSKEVAVRAALGAGPLRLVRQLLTEGLLLSITGGVLGFGLAWWGTGQLMRLAGAQIPRADEVGLDWRVFLFLLAACAVTGVLAGLTPALIAMRTDAQAALQGSGGRSTRGLGQRRLRDGLVVAELALAFALAVGATLLIRELVRLRTTETGMVTTNVMTFHVGHRMTPGTDPGQFYEIADRVGALPGVRAAGFIQMLPLQNWRWTAVSADFRVRNRPAVEVPPFEMELRYVTPGYFQALGVSIRRGRAFTTRDTRDAPPVILINEAMARRYFGNDDPVGADTNRGTIVGVVGDVRQVHLDRPASPEIYYPIAQNWSQVSDLGLTLVVRTLDRPEPLVDAVRSAVRDINPNLAVFNINTMDRVVADSLFDFTLYLSLMTGFAALALVLASTGTYGVISYVALARMREFAIRIAMGADASRVTRLVLGQGLRLTVIGLGIGLLGTLAASPLLRDLPVSVRPPSVIVTAPIAVLIAIVAVVACLIPARRAANVDPMSALRNE